MEVIECKCEKCGNDKSYKKKINNLEYGECTSCGTMTYSRMLSAPAEQLVRCPYCNSYKVEKISKFSKSTHIAAFGIFSLGKVTKQWHCTNCKSDF